jgi:ribonuclease HI
MERYKLEIWTDGSCYWKTRQGGSGAYIKFKDKEYFLREDWGYSNTTIERREIYAILMALRAIKKNVRCNVTFYIDRENVVNFIKNHAFDWKTGDFSDCSNLDLWKEFSKELDEHKHLAVRFKWIRGHQKNINDPIVYGNHVADILSDYKGFKVFKEDKYGTV